MMDKTPEGAADGDDLSFEEALARLEEIIEQLESGEMPLEESLQRFEEGMRLRAICVQKLKQTETRIEQVLAKTGENAEAEVDVENASENEEE